MEDTLILKCYDWDKVWLCEKGLDVDRDPGR